MKKLLMLLTLPLLALSAQARQTPLERHLARTSPEQLRPAVAVRASGYASMLGLKFETLDGGMFNPRPFMGGGAALGAAYEHPIAPKGIIAGGAGASWDKQLMNDSRDNAFYSYFTKTTVYAEIYYGLRLNHFYLNAGLRGGYSPLCTTEYRNGKEMYRGQLTKYHYTPGNVWALLQTGYTTGRLDIGLDLGYGLLSHFQEGIAFPVLNDWRQVHTTYLNAGVNISWRIFVGKSKK